MGGLWYGVGFLVAVMILLGLLMRRSESTGTRRFQEGRVTGISGRKGHGKTLFSVHELLRHVGSWHPCRECTARAGKRVRHRGHIATNGNLVLPEKLRELYHHVDAWDDLFDLPHATLVVIDEAHLGWAPAEAGKQLPKRVQWLLAQCRKLHLEIIWCSQHEDRVSLGLRRQTDEIGICERGLYKRMRVRFYDPEDARKKDVKARWVFRYRVSRRLAASYDTYELLMPERDSEDVSHDALMIDRRRSSFTPAPGEAGPAHDPVNEHEEAQAI